jgi:hypothetical protein
MKATRSASFLTQKNSIHNHVHRNLQHELLNHLADYIRVQSDIDPLLTFALIQHEERMQLTSE